MAEPKLAGPDADSGRSPSDDEKHVGATSRDDARPLDLPEDPDAGKSDEERANIVRIASDIYN